MADEVVLNAAEIARLAGVARGTVLTWRRRDDFPAPAGGARAGAVYNRAAVEAWLAAAGLWELSPGPRVWREVSYGAQGGSPGEAVRDAAAVAARLGGREALPPSVPGNLAWVMKRAVDDVGAVAVLNDLLDRYATASGLPVTPARIAECMISLAGVRDGATVLDPASGNGELLAAALAGGAGRVLAQDASTVTAELARARLFLVAGQSAEVAAGDALGADAFAGLEADAVVCRPPIPAIEPESAAAWAQYALTHLKPGGRAVLAMPPSAAAAPSGRQARAQMLRQGVLRTVIALPVAVAPPYVPLHLWVLERPDGKTEPDLLALFVEAAPEVRGGADYATSTAAGTMPAASWQAFRHSIEIAGDSPRNPGKRAICSGGGRNAKWCVTRVADLLDDTGLLDKSERLDETVDLTPARVQAHFSAWYREKDKESARRRGNVEPRNPATTFLHSRLGRFVIKLDVDAVAKIVQRLDWLGDAGDRRGVEPQLGLPAGPWRTATVPELARLGLLRYRHARSGHAELLRAGDVLVPAAVTKGTEATVVGGARAGDHAGPGVHVIRPNPAHLNSWFLAGFLLSPGNLRRATGNRVDVRQLEVPVLPLADQERYALAFRDMRSLETITSHLKDNAGSLASNLTAGLTSGDFRGPDSGNEEARPGNGGLPGRAACV
jgi:SAM-dependent methyltransferase